MDSGAEAIHDPAELQQVRRQATRVHVRALASSVAVTAVVIVVPW